MRYDFEAKQREFRAPFWAMVEGMSKKPRVLRTVAYLDTALALETKHLLSLGYSPERLHPVNRSAAQLARLTQALDEAGLPRVQTRGHAGEFHDVCRRLFMGGGLDIMAFDGCGNLESADFFGKHSLGEALLCCKPGILGYTLLAGREKHFEEIKNFATRFTDAVVFDSRGRRGSENLKARLRLGAYASMWTEHGPLFNLDAFKWSSYVSESGQLMGYCAMRIKPSVELSEAHKIFKNKSVA